VLGGFVVGDGAKIGSNAVVIKPVPAGATAVGIPARIIPSKEGESADVSAPQKFTAYGITQDDDPLSQAMRGLIDNASSQEHQIALLWQAIE
jgi:serine O-acetyltransferase